MKTFCLIFAFVAGISASTIPSGTLETDLLKSNEIDSRFVDGIVEGYINDLIETIKEAGLDPLQLDEFVYSYIPDSSVMFSGRITMKGVASTGLSNIVTARLTFSILTMTLNCELFIPELLVSVEDSLLEAVIVGNLVEAKISGRVAIIEPRIAITARVSILSGVSINTLSLNLGVGAVQSDVNVVVQDNDITATVNQGLGLIPELIETNQKTITDFLEPKALELINAYLRD